MSNRRQAITYTLAVRFIKDAHLMLIDGVNNYGISENANCYYVEKNGYYQYFNVNEVLYIGRAFDLGDGKKREVE